MALFARCGRVPQAHILRDRTLKNSLFVINRYCVKKTQVAEENEENEPIKFSTSEAANWKARYSFGVKPELQEESPWFEIHIVRISVILFLVYFCLLREESDIDLELGKPVAERFQEIQKLQQEKS